MIKIIPGKNLLLLFAVILTSGFALYIYATEMQYRYSIQAEINKTAEIISSPVWTLYTDASEPYLKQIMKDRNYSDLQVILTDGTKLLHLREDTLTNFDKILQKLNMVPVDEMSADVNHNGKKIAQIRVLIYNLNIYKYWNFFIIHLLLLVIAWIGIRLYESKKELEKRVVSRTKELKESRTRLEIALEASRTGIWDWSVRDNKVYFDENYYTIAGYKPYEFEPTFESFIARIHADDKAKTLEIVERYLSGKSNYYNSDFRFKRADGSWMWIFAQGRITERNSKGEALRFIGTHTDISIYKSLMDELKESEERYTTIFNKSHAVMLLINPKTGKIADANPAAVEFYGYSYDEFLKLYAFDLNLLPKEQTKAEMQAAIAGDKKVFNFQHKLASGEIRNVEAYAGPVTYKDNTYLFSIIHDITKRKIAEEEIKELNKNLQDKVEKELEKNRKQEEIIHNQKKLADIGNMISAISHQWRQPLNALGFYIQDVTDAFAHGDIDKKYLESFEKSTMDIVQHLSGTIDDFRYFYLPDKDASEMNVLTEIYSLLRLTLAQIRNNHISITLTCSCDTCEYVSENLEIEPNCHLKDSLVKGYKGEFKQVIANLIYNSIDAIKLKNRFDGAITVSVSNTFSDVFIRIHDNGGGIPEDAAPNVFFPYFSTKTDSKGTGIGLYMSKAIIEEHMNGSIWFENDNEGVTFIIKLPKINSSFLIKQL